MIYCSCGSEIPQERINFFQDSGRICKTCIKCSKEEKKFAVTVWPHKTGSYVVILPQTNDGKTDPETKRQALRAEWRER